ncbi:hypothetical protein F5Y18DRAFT_411321 [Xylariaceae sp. FL1019]|nr:hypothetical protein F5Y18DRAFT_411321 [Xylariaceae sp. FL1019]
MRRSVIQGWLADVASSASHPPPPCDSERRPLNPAILPTHTGKEHKEPHDANALRKRSLAAIAGPSLQPPSQQNISPKKRRRVSIDDKDRPPAEPNPQGTPLGAMDGNATRPQRISSRNKKTRPPLAHDNADDDVFGAAPDSVPVGNLQATPRPSRSISSRSRYLTRLNETTTLPPSTASNSSRTSRTRSTSPIKRASDLLKLSKPVHWIQVNMKDLSKRVAETKQPSAVLMFDKIRRIARSFKGYLPAQLQQPLEDELGLSDDDADKFATRDPLLLDETTLARHEAKARRLLGDTATDADLLSFVLVREPLEAELERLQGIVDRTGAFKTTPHAEATWNEQIHAPMLDLAVRSQPNVGYENVTRANIASPFLPKSMADISLPLGSKMIDYAMTIDTDTCGVLGAASVASSQGKSDDLAQHIRTFTSRLTPNIFNQTQYEPLRNCPTGVFFETKVDGKSGWSEGKAQLGFWLASWFQRVAMFPPPGSASDPEGQPVLLGGLPFFPVVLAVGDKWELHLAFEEGTGLVIYGGLDIGGTGDLDDAYRALAVLRVLAQDWMAGDFRAWVKSRVSY